MHLADAFAPAARRPPRPGLRLRAALSLPLILAILVSGSPALAASCTTSGPSSGAYTVTVCIDEPVAGSSVTGRTTVRARATVTGSTAGIRSMSFRVAGGFVLTDFAAPYTFILPTERWVDGTRPLTAEARLSTGFLSKRASASLTFANGVTTVPGPESTFQPRTGTSPDPGRPPVVAVVGDGADGTSAADRVVGLIDSWDPNLMLYLGDVYDQGTATEMLNWYGDAGQRWGRFRDITNPVVGNHEYGAGPGAPGYQWYWGSPPHHYGVDVGGWRLLGLDTTTQYGQRDVGTEQHTWLEQELAATVARCTLAFAHHPRYSAGGHGDDEGMAPIWASMAGGGADLYLAGHDHNYQRWKPLDASGRETADGLTQFIVGTGGHGVYRFERTEPRLAAGLDRAPNGFGALRLELNVRGAAFAYSRSDGTLLDWGSVPCRGTGPDVTPPAPPSDLVATPGERGGIDLAWTTSVDDVGVTGYRILRDDVPIATSPPVGAFHDAAVEPGSTHTYRVTALDAAGGESPPSGEATATAPSALFRDGFETGNLSRWSASSRLVVQQQEVASGTWAARAVTTGGPGAWARHHLTTPRSAVVASARFKIIGRSSAANLLTVQTAAGGGLARLYLGTGGNLAIRNVVAARTFSSSTVPATGVWHELEFGVSVAGAGSRVEVWLDGVKIGALDKVTALGTTPIGRFILGETSSATTFDIAYDDVELST